MNDKTDGNRAVLQAGLIAVLAAVTALTASCGIVHIHIETSVRSSPVDSATFRHDLEFARCMHSHGEPAFPDPTVLGGRPHFDLHSLSTQSTQFHAAVNACRPLIPRGLSLL
jgi:hypothetical protein